MSDDEMIGVEDSTPEPEPETDERPNEESIVLGLSVLGGMPVSMAGPVLGAIGSMYPAAMWTTNAADLAKVPVGTTMAVRIPLADILGFAEDEAELDDHDGWDVHPEIGPDAERLIRIIADDLGPCLRDHPEDERLSRIEASLRFLIGERK